MMPISEEVCATRSLRSGTRLGRLSDRLLEYRILWRWKCGLLVDYLIAAGEMAFNIVGPGHTEQAHMTQAAKSAACGVLTYPAKV